LFWDAAILSSHAKPPADAPHDTIPVHVTFVDWIPGICSTLGLLIVNLINKEHLIAQGAFHQEDAIVWRARLFLFLGFALMAGGLAGSVVRVNKPKGAWVLTTHLSPSDDIGLEVYSTKLRGALRLLWMGECGSKCVVDVIGYCALARPACSQ
jgi:hypothetical protein